MNSVTHHLNPGSHTSMTCVQHPTGAHLCMQPFLNGLDRTLESLKTGCRLDLGCGECGKTGYKSCRAQKQYYFNVMVPAMLCEQFRVLQGYKKQMLEGNPSAGYGMDRKQLKQLMLSIVIQAFGLQWEKGRNRN